MHWTCRFISVAVISRLRRRSEMFQNYRMLARHRKLILSVGLLLCLMIWMWQCGWVQQYGFKHQRHDARMESKSNFFSGMQPLKILWWTNVMATSNERTFYCSAYKCTFSSNRKLLPEAAAVIFYASNLAIDDLPLPRLPKHLWALVHEESPRNVPFIPYANVLQHFNFTSTFSRHSDFPLTLQYLPRLELLTAPTYMLPVGQKTLLRDDDKVSAIAFIQSDCDTMSGRDEYVRQLMQHISIDSYGKCLHNRDLPKSLTVDYLNKLYSPELLHFLGRYKFILSYENGICQDYITEKFWRPLIVGAIPIYFGSPTIRDWQPNDKSVIHIADFASPKALAEFLKKLEDNDTEYNTYMRHKYDMLEPISNRRLLQELHNREYEGDADMFQYFECAVCRQLHELPPQQTKMATVAHYNCSLPLVYPPMERHSVSSNNNNIDFGGDSGWEWIVATGKCEAHVLNQLLQRNQNYTRPEFDTLLNSAFEANDCN